MNTSPKVYWKIVLGALMILCAGQEIIRLSVAKFSGEIGMMMTSSVCICVGGFYLLYTGLYPKKES